MTRRGISRNRVESVMASPDKILHQGDCIKVFQKIAITDKRTYLYRVFVNNCKEPALVITVYKTSKIEKYEN
jgi:hypothetical protein